MTNDLQNILSFLPHRPPFVMVSELVSATEGHFETRFFVSSENLFVENGKLSESALIENIAQSCACGLGFLSQKAGEPAKTGYIGSVSKLKVHRLPPVNCMIDTHAQVTFKMGNIYVIKGENFLDGDMLLQCEMKIVAQ